MLWWYSSSLCVCVFPDASDIVYQSVRQTTPAGDGESPILSGVSGREGSLFLFRTLGKILYCKRQQYASHMYTHTCTMTMALFLVHCRIWRKWSLQFILSSSPPCTSHATTATSKSRGEIASEFKVGIWCQMIPPLGPCWSISFVTRVVDNVSAAELLKFFWGCEWYGKWVGILSWWLCYLIWQHTCTLYVIDPGIFLSQHGWYSGISVDRL